MCIRDSGGDLQITQEGKEIGEVIRLVLNPVWSAWSFFTLYANADGLRGHLIQDANGVLDRYALCKTRELVEEVTEAFDAYDISRATQGVRGYLDALNNWYIRRSRPRFWSSELDADKQAAYDTLYTCLHTLVRTVAPLLPFLAEEIYAGLVGGDAEAPSSVHLCTWPDASQLPKNEELVEAMDRVRDVCSTTLALREAERLRVLSLIHI